MGFDPTGIINEGASAILGIGLGDYNDNRQQRQQKALQDIQIEGQKEMTDYNMQKQLQMWHDTNYGAQVDELNKAGLNPGLLYGKGGSGGTTTGSANGSVSGGSAQQNPGEVQQMMAIELQTQLQQAQIEVMKSQAEKNLADAKATSGVQTDVGKQNIVESQARTQTLMQGYDNMRQDYEIKRLEVTMKNIENFEKQSTQADRMSYIGSQAAQAINIVKSTAAEANIDQATVNEKIKIIQQQAIESGLKNILLQSNITKTNQEIKTIAANLSNIPNIMSNDNQRLEIQKQLKNWNTDPNIKAMDQIANMIGHILKFSK